MEDLENFWHDVPCPVCGGKVQVRKTKAKKNYYICENNKGVDQGCSYISWNAPKPGEVFDPSSVKVVSNTETKQTKKSTEKKASTKKASSKKTTSKETKAKASGKTKTTKSNK